MSNYKCVLTLYNYWLSSFSLSLLVSSSLHSLLFHLPLFSPLPPSLSNHPLSPLSLLSLFFSVFSFPLSFLFSLPPSSLFSSHYN